jgi:hypothetical protein
MAVDMAGGGSSGMAGGEDSRREHQGLVENLMFKKYLQMDTMKTISLTADPVILSKYPEVIAITD